MRAGDSGSRGTRRLQPAVPGLNRPCRSTSTGAGHAMRQPGHGEQVRAPARFTVAGRATSGGTGTSAVRLAAQTAPPRERADHFPADRWPVMAGRRRGRRDCGGVHQTSGIPAVQAVTAILAPRRHPLSLPAELSTGCALPAAVAGTQNNPALHPRRPRGATHYEMAVSIRSRFFLDGQNESL